MSRILLPRSRLAYKWWVVVVVTLGMFMSIMDNTIVNIAIPQMQHAFNANISGVQWIVTIYMLTQAAVIPAAPYLNTRLGGKRAYVWTLAAFLLGSLLCGFAWNLPSLVVFRLIQGIGGGILLPMVMILLYQAFPIEERGLATSTMGIPMMFAPAFGPVLGGYLVTYLGWQWAFFINVPLGIIGVVIAQKVLREKHSDRTTHFDVTGFATIACGSAILLYGISTIRGSSDPVGSLSILLAGITILCVFVVIEIRKARRGEDPLLNLGRFRDTTFTLSVLGLVLYTFVYFGILFLIPIYLQNLHHESAQRAGVIQAAIALATLAILPFAGRLSDRIGPRPVALAGLVFATTAAILMMTLALNTPIWQVVGILAVLGLGAGLAGQIQVAAMSRIQREEHQEVANGTTLISVMRATAAPLGVTTLSVIVQARSEQHTGRFADAVARQQGTLLAMHDGFLVASILVALAFIGMWFAPARRKQIDNALRKNPGISASSQG